MFASSDVRQTAADSAGEPTDTDSVVWGEDCQQDKFVTEKQAAWHSARIITSHQHNCFACNCLVFV